MLKKDVEVLLKLNNLSPEEEHKLHDIYEKNRQKQLSREEYVFDQGVEKGIEKRLEKDKLESARSMLADGFPPATISKYIKLTIEEIEQLR